MCYGAAAERDMHEPTVSETRSMFAFGVEGAWNVMLATLVDLGLTNNWQHMVESTIVRSTSGSGRERGPARKGVGRGCGGYISKSHRCDGQGRTLASALTSGEVFDHRVTPAYPPLK